MNVTKSTGKDKLYSMSKKLSLFLLLFAFLFCFHEAFACSIFNAHKGDMVLVGNNEDWLYSTDVKVWFVPPTPKSYGRVCLGWKQLLFFKQAQGGMNDQGLFLDWALCPKSKIPRFSFKKKIATFSLPDKLLAECSTVEEGIKWLKHYTFLYIRSHIMLVDKNGNSAVVEWVEGELKVIHKKGRYQIITNFWLSHPELGNFPCTRYNKITEMLENMDSISVNYFKSILKKVTNYNKTDNEKESGTIYSNIYDLGNGEVYIYYKRDFENAVKFNLENELAKGKQVYTLRALFSKNKE